MEVNCYIHASKKTTIEAKPTSNGIIVFLPWKYILKVSQCSGPETQKPFVSCKVSKSNRSSKTKERTFIFNYNEGVFPCVSHNYSKDSLQHAAPAATWRARGADVIHRSSPQPRGKRWWCYCCTAWSEGAPSGPKTVCAAFEDAGATRASRIGVSMYQCFNVSVILVSGWRGSSAQNRRNVHCCFALCVCFCLSSPWRWPFAPSFLLKYIGKGGIYRPPSL